ncbi:N-acetyl-gamma-glutamyl-phosphate reductase [Halanaerobium hydrogeniformans]|uniref:N-acetyl-gamma-glutamyl-phosphate reductase n=1 Tax=Halanaerobium hydrogeniformans TaxID=656519 RepID=E4RMZ2_HALHG|nr:N-acetyl-gamma-glutamyl-phosphate reductase [Halanaerobium hydrogeniformans]ADQ14209.1 N-acetyl-gamma-glutamyl-phosphate reductase [Halanaerobium hydrogeniformans]
MIKVSIVGATGYVGIELMRLLQQHPQVIIKDLISKSNAKKKLVDVYPQFRGSKLENYTLIALEDFQPEDSDLIFSALPHGVSQDISSQLIKSGTKIIDMSGDFRYHDIEIYEKWYGVEHKHPELAKKAVYGLTELNRTQIKNAEFIANPGCYVTASLLGILPLIDSDLVKTESIIIDAKSGVSGAGRSLKSNLLFTECHNTMKAYSPAVHRHSSEIEYILNEFLQGSYDSRSSEQRAEILFTPHLIPIKRGILTTIYLDCKRKSSDSEIFSLYEDFYGQEKFVQVLKDELPEIKNIAGSNFAQLGFKYDQRTDRIIVISVIDNMLKGAAGQAVQNMNVLFGIDEDTGLQATALFP